MRRVVQQLQGHQQLQGQVGREAQLQGQVLQRMRNVEQLLQGQVVAQMKHEQQAQMKQG